MFYLLDTTNGRDVSWGCGWARVGDLKSVTNLRTTSAIAMVSLLGLGFGIATEKVENLKNEVMCGRFLGFIRVWW